MHGQGKPRDHPDVPLSAYSITCTCSLWFSPRAAERFCQAIQGATITRVTPTLSGSNSVVECQLPKLDVAGSIPVSRSKFFPQKLENKNHLPQRAQRTQRKETVYKFPRGCQSVLSALSASSAVNFAPSRPLRVKWFSIPAIILAYNRIT